MSRATTEFDPLAKDNTLDEGLLAAAQRREIKNILKSYTGYYDLFCELLQNAFDSVERRFRAGAEKGYEPTVWLTINMQTKSISVTDNGVGLTEDQLKHFLRPNISYKTDGTTRGNKGVGATYLAYGFNYLQVGTRTPDFEYVGVLTHGRDWVEDKASIVARPKMRPATLDDLEFSKVDRGATFTLKLTGDNIRPKELGWIGASSASQFVTALRVHTPLGGVYLTQAPPPIRCEVRVTNLSGETSTEVASPCEFLYPHTVISSCASLKEIIAHQVKQVQKGPAWKKPDKFSQLNAIYGTWTADELLSDQSPINLKAVLDDEGKALLKASEVTMYVFFCYSTSLWDNFNDRVAKLRKGNRILRGGLQLATNGMVQGGLITIPLTESIGYQNTTFVIVHFNNADPDLGRKGFQPEHSELGTTLAKAAVAGFKRWGRDHLKKDTGAPKVQQDFERYEWLKEQEAHAVKYPLIIKGTGLFAPLEEIPIASKPMLEQDVVALFNQLLAAGVVRGFKVLATSEHQQYDGVVKIEVAPPHDKFIYDKVINPLGVPQELFADSPVIKTPPNILEYKYNLDALIGEFDKDLKRPEHIDMLVAWEAGTAWKERYDVTSFLLPENIHLRTFHGVTHQFKNTVTGQHAFYAIILEDLVNYLMDPEKEQQRQELLYGHE